MYMGEKVMKIEVKISEMERKSMRLYTFFKITDRMKMATQQR